MQFFCLVYYCFDVWTLQEGNFSNDFFIWYLLLCEIVVSHVTYCFEAIGERNVAFLSLMLMSEPFEDILIFNIFVVQLDLSRLDGHLSSMLFRDVFNGEVAADEDEFFLGVASYDSLVTR